MIAEPLTAVRAYDPELAPHIADLPVLDLVDYRGTRRASRPAPAEPPAGIRVEDRVVGGTVPVRVYRPGGGERLPAIVHFHSGGYVTGSVDSSHGHCATLSAETGAVVVSVDYRLAPEHPFPAAFDDGMAALEWLHAEADDLTIDPAAVAVHGRSAGGGLAARVAVEARDRGLPVRFQYLNCPQLDPVAAGASMTAFADTPFVTTDTIRTAWRHYLGAADNLTDDLLTAASAAHAPELAGVAPAYVAVMEFDPLRDEGIAYAARLLRSDVPVELHAFPGTFHCSAMVVRSATVSRRELAEELAVLRRALSADRTAR